MGKSEKTAFILVTAILVCLLSVIIVRTFSGHNDVRVYRVSIITDDVQGDYSQNVWKGLDRAARDYNIDLQVIAMHSGMTTEQQKSSLERELEADTDAIIINLQRNPSLSEQLDLSADAFGLHHFHAGRGRGHHDGHRNAQPAPPSQPATTSLGKCTPSSTRLQATRADMTIATAISV